MTTPITTTPVGQTVQAVVEPSPASHVLHEVKPAGAGGNIGDDSSAMEPSAEFLKLVGHEFARRHLILSNGVRSGVEHLLVASTTTPAPIFNVGVRLGRATITHIREAETLAAAIDTAFARVQRDAHSDATRDALSAAGGGGGPSVTVEGSGDLETDMAAAVRETERDLLSTSGKSPAVRLVDLVLFEALLRAASDVHIQPVRDRTLVRYRLDGALHTVRELPGSIAAAVVSRIKVMSALDVAEQRAPQDGRATVTIGGASKDQASKSQAGRRIDLRVSTLPNSYGERVVIRLLDPARSPHLLNFGALGMPTAVERLYLDQVTRTSGIVLSTGPTGSGKTTTLYTTLAWINSTNAGAQTRGCELNIMTVEDPVEYDLSTSGLSISQTQVNPKKNVTFATGLRHILRQDPDVIMVGEIRDEETARMAVQASLTGHLVLSTLHTSDAASAVARLLDLCVEPFLVSSSLASVLAQRLVRRVHQPCRGEGCAECMQTGYKGRQGVFELLVLDGPIREMVGRRSSAVEIKNAAQSAGMVTLREAGLHLVRAGVTTREEVTRVIENVEEELP